MDAPRVRRLDRRQRLVRAQQVQLRQDHAVRLLRQLRRVGAQLLHQDPVFPLHILRVERDQVGEGPRALDVAEEPEPEPAPLVRALDDPRDVGDDERPVPRQLDDAQVRLERREWILRDLRARGRDRGQERRLPCVRLADEPDVRDQLQLQGDPPFLARLALLPPPRRAVRWCDERRVPAPATAASRDHQLLTILEELAEHLARVRVLHDRTRRDAEDQVRTVPARLVLPHPVLAALGAVVLVVAEIQERRELVVRAEHDVAPLPAVSAPRSAARDTGLTTERRHPGTARARVNIDHRVIYEHLASYPSAWIGPRPHARRRPCVRTRPARPRVTARASLPTDDGPRPRPASPTPSGRAGAPRTPAPAPLRPRRPTRPRSTRRADAHRAGAPHPAPPGSRRCTAP